ncbi:helix-turn-helix domain-containing protein [Streptomyces sp. NPDC007088]|uniref:helix-turn-helix domain-containing protein n=1 Tax=Streptomyces sp. NPDC007088 TaxID=3364773 RepID=UPI0036871116
MLDAVKPLVDALGAQVLEPRAAGPEDVMLSWEGEEVFAVRLPRLAESLDRILAGLERVHGPLAALDRRTKQDVVKQLEGRGAFTVRHGVETVASALGVSRFTVYNYINYANEQRAKGERSAEGERGAEGGRDASRKP